jgi:hypothetical protein
VVIDGRVVKTIGFDPEAVEANVAGFGCGFEDGSTAAYLAAVYDDALKLDQVLWNGDGTVTLEGAAAPGAKIEVLFSAHLRDFTKVGDATAGDDGKVTFSHQTDSPSGNYFLQMNALFDFTR